jgi:two-component system, OmpR family, sensor histidine kinase BaeS
MAQPPFEDQTDALNVAWSDVVRFIRQLSHDLRNHLNAIELQSAYISELQGDELRGEITRLRGMISGLTSALQALTRAVSGVKPNLIPYRAADLAEDLRKKIDHDFSGQGTAITWNIQVGDAMLNVDPQLLQEALSELFSNAFRHIGGKGNVVVTAKMENSEFLFTIEEPKARLEGTADNWGCAPLQKITPNHYGLGLHRVRAIIEAHDGKMHAHYDPDVSVLTTTLALPGSSGSSKDA